MRILKVNLKCRGKGIDQNMALMTPGIYSIFTVLL